MSYLNKAMIATILMFVLSVFGGQSLFAKIALFILLFTGFYFAVRAVLQSIKKGPYAPSSNGTEQEAGNKD